MKKYCCILFCSLLNLNFLLGCAASNEIKREIQLIKNEISNIDHKLERLENDLNGKIASSNLQSNSKIEQLNNKIDINERKIDEGVSIYYERILQMRYNVKRLCEKQPGTCK